MRLFTTRKTTKLNFCSFFSKEPFRALPGVRLKTVLSRCHRARQQALGPLGFPLPGAFVPVCKADGRYNETQCHHSSGYCWCVNELGQEQHGTRRRGQPTCKQPGKSM